MSNPRATAPGLPVLDFAALDAMVRNCPFHAWLGVRLLSLDPSEIAITMPWRGEFVSEPTTGYAHGGILASLIDLAADYAVAAHLGRSVPTIDLRVDYHRAASPGTLTARAAVIKLGASGRGVYLTLPPNAAKGALS